MSMSVVEHNNHRVSFSYFIPYLHVLWSKLIPRLWPVRHYLCGNILPRINIPEPVVILVTTFILCLPSVLNLSRTKDNFSERENNTKWIVDEECSEHGTRLELLFWLCFSICDPGQWNHFPLEKSFSSLITVFWFDSHHLTSSHLFVHFSPGE